MNEDDSVNTDSRYIISEKQYKEIMYIATDYIIGRDSSHDVQHALRVCSQATKIIQSMRSGIVEDDAWSDELCMLVVVSASLIHDAIDHKYVDCEEKKQSVLESIKVRLSKVIGNIGADAVALIITNMSFSQKKALTTQELAPFGVLRDIVRDADRLDAMGAVGIARCFAYTAASGQSFYEARAHFSEKLLTLHETLVTPQARAIATELHDHMVEFVRWFDQETGTDNVERWNQSCGKG
ncbi:hypothetical protein J8273_7026 [Carpediemonas membranifera]|uniref:HD/PDEase domain-containing protein n=1 Tax=Carpediemonas membranifera TaxID=201153 RepID=A0A8J6DZI7_9EUKA|nr:hypothetical protein J8273_7026 [Carpediemonas membranifera]|eukprot:KAG9390773.1 hypothetical protein J8273_7026 [Carpediemonas membranifera]